VEPAAASPRSQLDSEELKVKRKPEQGIVFSFEERFLLSTLKFSPFN
jgi:hypothetical protein